MNQTRERPTLTRQMEINSIRAVEGEGNERKFALSFSSEAPYERWDGPEILDHKDGAIDMTRLQEIGVVLYNHNRDAVIGRINKAWVEDNRGMAEIEFDTDDESEKIYQKVKSGTLKGVSVGYAITEIEAVKAGKKSLDGRFKGPANVATKWMPFEISIVSVPADASVGVGRSMEDCCNPKVKNSISYWERQLQINLNQVQ